MDIFNFSPIFIWVSVFAFSAALINGLGIWVIFKHRKWAEKAKIYFMCFAAGILISTPLILALPKAVQKNSYAGFIALLGFLFMFFSNKFIRKKTKKESLAFGLIAAEGIGIHSFVDGIIYTVTFNVSALIGVLSGIGLVVHEFAEGVITFMFLIQGGMSEKKAAWYAFLIAGLTTPIGAFLFYPFIYKLSGETLGLLLGFVAGVLLYISSSHLLPAIREEEKGHSILAFLLGIILALFIVFSKTY